MEGRSGGIAGVVAETREGVDRGSGGGDPEDPQRNEGWVAGQKAELDSKSGDHWRSQRKTHKKTTNMLKVCQGENHTQPLQLTSEKYTSKTYTPKQPEPHIKSPDHDICHHNGTKLFPSVEHTCSMQRLISHVVKI